MTSSSGKPASNGKHKPTRTSQPTDSAFREIIRVFGLLERVMQGHFARFGISGAQWGLLRNLYRAEEEGQSGIRLTDLADRMLIRPPSVTAGVERLERAGLVAKTGSSTDLRVKQVALTAKGRQLVGQALAVHQGQVARVMAGLTRDEQQELHRLLAKLGQHLYALSEAVPPAEE